MKDRTLEVVLRQIRAMGTDHFEVGLFKPGASADMILRTWDRQALMESIPWLKFQNADGRNIYIRPKGEHPLTGVYWEFGDYDAIVTLTAKEGKVVGMTFWTKKDFGESKLHRTKTAQSISALKLDTNTKGVSIEKNDKR